MASNSNPLSSAEQQALIWPIQAKGAVTRLNPLNDPAISQYYPNSMEQGRFLESSIADANNFLLQKMQILKAYITSYTHMNSLAVDGQLGQSARVPKYIADSISILQTAQQIQQQLVQLAQAVQKNISTIQMIEQNMLQMVQNTLNAIANLLNNICNWGLPSIPSIPNLFPDQLWNWNGFQFSPLALFALSKSNTTFSLNFSFSQCSMGTAATSSTFSSNTNPISVTNYSGLTFGSGTYFTPPFDGTVVSAEQSLTDPAFIATMQANTVNPVFNTTFNPLQNMWGAMPDPHYIISNWQPGLASGSTTSVLDNYIVSICPQLRGNTVFTTDSDYDSPDYALRDLQLRKDLISFANLGTIVSSNFDPLLTAAWLIYLGLDRQGRGGVWIPNFEAVYQQYIQPSLSAVTTLSVPWNSVLGTADFIWMSQWDSATAYIADDIVTYGGATWQALAANTDVVPGTDATTWQQASPDTVYSNAPVIPLLTTFASLPQNQLNHLLWQLSYVEASLLGYTRNPTWDSYQDNSYLNGPTGSDLDYKATAISTAVTNLTLGTATAEFPVPVTFPTSFADTMATVVELASADIQADTSYLSPKLANRFTYNQFAQATQVDRFSQFWRDFASNLKVFLAQDPYLVQFAATYPDILNGAVNPLGDPTAYNSLLADVASRSRTWTPGTPLLPIPVQPVTIPPSSFAPGLNNNGWTNNMTFNPAAFLARPDVQALPIPTQIAMLRTNLSYAGVNVWKNNMQTSIATAMSNANALLQATQQVGFHVSIYDVDASNQVPPGTSVQVSFDAMQLPQDFDYTGNVTTLSPGLFTIQAAGTYNGVGTFSWEVPAAGTYTITVTQNGTPIATASSTTTGAGTTTTNVSFNQQFNTDDTVEVLASTSLPSGTAQVEPVSTFSMILAQVSSSSGGNTPSTQGNTASFDLDVPAWFPSATVPVLTAVSIDADGNATPLDPSVPTITSVQITAPSTIVVQVNANNFANGDLIVFSGVGVADFIDGQTATVTAVAPTQITATFTTFTYSNYGPTADSGSVLYAIDSSGAVLAPNPDGVTLTSGSQGDSVTVTTYYGEQYYVTLDYAAVTATSVSSDVLTVTADNDLTAGQSVLLEGTAESFLNGQTVTVLSTGLSATQFTASFATADYSNPSDTGTASPADQTAVGGLLYAGLGGRLTQDYASLTTGSPVAAFGPVGWIICIGRVIAYDADTQTMTFIYEPHVPTRFSAMI